MIGVDPLAPLLEEERHAGGAALVAYPPKPIDRRRPCTCAARIARRRRSPRSMRRGPVSDAEKSTRPSAWLMGDEPRSMRRRQPQFRQIPCGLIGVAHCGADRHARQPVDRVPMRRHHRGGVADAQLGPVAASAAATASALSDETDRRAMPAARWLSNTSASEQQNTRARTCAASARRSQRSGCCQ